jgi:spheroidene monooxygenase
MTHASQALGVNCTYCHNTRSFQSWQDNPPQRAVAWYGIRMARAINKDYLEPLASVFPAHRKGELGDVAKANCATCHQGSYKPLNGAQMARDFPELRRPPTRHRQWPRSSESAHQPEVITMEASPVAPLVLSGVVVILLVDLANQNRAWGWLRLVQGPGVFRDVPGLLFVKVMGSGHGGGFGLRPSPTHRGLVCLFSDRQKADDFMRGEEAQGYISRAREHWMGLLAVTSIRGQWDQQSWALTPAEMLDSPVGEGAAANTPQEPVAVLTRGSIRPAKAVSFWRYSPPAQAELNRTTGCQLAMGLGEAPLVRQCTFTVWDDTECMVHYAHHGAHKAAIAAAAKHDFFSESMFARMRVLAMSGTWRGRSFGAAPAPHAEVAHA